MLSYLDFSIVTVYIYIDKLMQFTKQTVATATNGIGLVIFTLRKVFKHLLI
jgi:hypothetical protein